MKRDYTEKQLQRIAEECSEFEHLINAMNYGPSLLNFAPCNCVRRCPDCTNWSDSSCDIFQREIAEWEE